MVHLGLLAFTNMHHLFYQKNDAKKLLMFHNLKYKLGPFVSSGSCRDAVERAAAGTDIGAVLPLGRQHSLLNIINVVIQKLGHLIEVYLPKVLQILLCVTASVSAMLEIREQVGHLD